MSIIATIENITPKMAEEYLEHNTNNYRRVSNEKVNSYAEDMKHGLWQQNGEGIVFGEDGTLKDGQHRLKAIVKSGATIPMLVIRGVANDVQMYDIGMSRTIGQIMKANGFVASTDMVGAARTFVGGFHGTAPKGIVQKYLEEHQNELHEATLMARRGFHKPIGKKVSVCLAVYVCRRLNLVNDEILDDFFCVFNSGTIKPNQMRDPSPALIASRTFLTKLNGGNASTSVKQYVTIMQALEDFKKNRNRKKEYQTDVMKPLEILNHLRMIDGYPTANS